jgi:succinate---hydroxymethylglutarate CoA-transferase
LKHTSNGPLNGLRVLEFGQIAAGPFVGMLLADLGADVVKVERPDGGDTMREWPPLIQNADSGERFSGSFASLNRNKRSIVVDLKNPKAVARLRALCDETDVIVENFRPGVLTRLGLGYEVLSDSNPRLVYCSVSGYGQSGPYAQKGAFDVTVQAISGVMSVTGEADGPAAKCGVPVGDFTAALYAAYAIAAVAGQAARTGRGGYIDCSMLGAILGISAMQVAEFYGTSIPPKRLGSAHPRNAPYQGFEANDGQFVVAAGNQELWRRFCDVIGRPALADHPQFSTQEMRARNQRALAAILQPIFAGRSRAEWIAGLDANGIPCAPVNGYDAILSDDHVKGMGLIHDLMLPNSAAIKTIGFPVEITGYQFHVERQPPALGEHTEEVFEQWLGASVS